MISTRQVRQLVPPPADEDASRRRAFSEFVDQPNVVLLGDPGAGKSHLFRSFAAATGGRFLTVRNFLNSPPILGEATLFIDALDEKRSGRGDDDAIDQVVRKLFASPPLKVRISCRERDWLGESDLAAFQTYFDQHGGVVVLSLQGLSADEQRTILKTQNIADPDAFLDEAAERGLEDLLINPQNLIMLAQVVRNGQWPTTRLELFETFTRQLLSEHNPERARAGEGVYDADELYSAAGAVCAARLISDVEGISLSDQSNTPDYPSYRTVGALDAAKVRAALGRRAFTTGGQLDTVDYIHRTTAEYLAAKWLAQRVRSGLPIGRVRSLVGIDGHPATELRGLHAWLTVLLPEHADLLLDSDPYGVLIYGDAASLTPSSRQRLLEALSRLSQIDPWFRAGNWSSARLGGLASPEMVDAFHRILASTDANFALRSIVIDALAAAAPLPALKGDLIEILARGDVPYAERYGALTALLQMGEAGKEAVVRVYRDHLGLDVPTIRLRAEIASTLYGDPFTSSDIAAILVSALTCAGDLPTGAFWSLPKRIPLADIAAVLDQFDPRESEDRQPHWNRRNSFNVARVIDSLLLRVLSEAEELSSPRLWKWLHQRRAFHELSGGGKPEDIRKALKVRYDVVLQMIDEAVSTLVANEHPLVFLFDLHETTLGAIDDDDLLRRIAGHLTRAEGKSDKEAFLYKLALLLSFNGTRSAGAVFEELYALSDRRAWLTTVRDEAVVVPIQEWRTKHASRRAQKEKEYDEGIAENIRELKVNEAAIRSGSHIGWVGWLANIYFGHFADLDEAATPMARLTRTLGQENALSAIEGLIAVSRRADIPSLDTVARMAAEHKHYDWWYAIIAGIDERWKQDPSLVEWSDDLLRVVLALELAYPTFEHATGTMQQGDRGWKIAAFETRPHIARDAYLALAEAGLRSGEEHIDGLFELLANDAFIPFRRQIAFQFIRTYPNASANYLRRLLECASGISGAQEELLSIARDVLHGVTPLDEGNRDSWLVAAYLASPQEFFPDITARAAEGPGIVWLLRDMGGFVGNESKHQPALTIAQLEFVAGIAAEHFPNASHPRGSWSGDRNAWDGAEFVMHIVNRISGQPTEEAASALRRLGADHRLVTYFDEIKHALASQQTRWRDSKFQRPNWRQTISALSNGVPANVADLHAMLLVNLDDSKKRIASANNDIYKRFWNEDGFGRIESPKPEESCRDVLVDLLRTSFQPLGIIVEPEGHMVTDKRADIVVLHSAQKIPVELKRDYHSEVWTAAEAQLDRFYTRDPEASGFGVYGVFWFGQKRPRAMPLPPDGRLTPQSAAEMEAMLRAMIPEEKSARIAVVVIDVSGETSLSGGPAPTSRSPDPKSSSRSG